MRKLMKQMPRRKMSVAARYTIPDDGFTKAMLDREQVGNLDGVILHNINAEDYSQTANPTVSIVVPAYNAEPYLEENIKGYLQQTFDDFEIIIVNDGSTDRTKQISSELLKFDSRVRYVEKPNGGLSSARNAGVQFVKGRYIFFIDPDDTMESNTLDRLVDKALHTGSDIVIAGYDLEVNHQYVKPGLWMQALFAKEYTHTSLIKSPELIQAAVAWGKLYKTSFYRKNQLAFIDGILYEDQPFTSKAFTLATKGIDCIGGRYIHWLQRDASISHQVTEKDLSARLDSAEYTLSNFAEDRFSDIYQTRLVQYLNHDFRQSLRNFGRISAEFDEILLQRIPEFYGRLNDKSRIDGVIEPVYDLLLAGKREELVNFVFDNEIKVQKTKIINRDGLGYADWTPYAYVDAHLNGDNVISNEYIQPYARLLDYDVKDKQVRFNVQAYLTHLSPDTFDYQVSLDLIDSKTHKSVLTVQGQASERRPDLIRESNDWFADYSEAVYQLVVPISALKLRKKYDFQLTIKAGQYDAEVLLDRLKGETVASYRVAPVSPTRRIRLLVENGSLRVKQSAVVELKQARVIGQTLHLVLRTGSNLKSGYLNVFDKKDKRLDLKVTKLFKYHYLISVKLNKIAGLKSNWLKLRLINAKKVELRAQLFGREHLDLGNGYSFSNTPTGDLELSTEAMVRINQVVATTDELQVTTEILNSLRDTNDVIVRLEAGSVKSDHHFQMKNNASDVLRVPMTYDQFGQVKPLPVASYTLTVWIDQSGWKQTQRTRLKFDDPLVKQLPKDLYEDGFLNTQIRYSYKNNRILVQRFNALPDAQKGGLGWGQMFTGYRNSVKPVVKNTLMLTTYYGETATDNALAIWKYAQAHPELNLNCVWAVKNQYTMVPDGAKTVLIGSKEWFHLLATAEYLIANVHPNAMVRKKPGQKIVENFHGYPYKLMGHEYYVKNGYSKQRIRSFEIRENEFDYILAPAHYAEALYQEAFNFHGKFLTVGHPRNDLLTDPDAADARQAINQRLRRELNIAEDKKVVLYAPTYRETNSLNEFSAKMVHFFDVKAFASLLGDDYVILVRGHMMNRRAGYHFEDTPNIIDVTQYPEIRDLIITSDMGILDYSSLRFDYAQTKKPMIFLVPDIEEYEANRGGLMDYKSTAPGPLVADMYQLLEAVRAYKTYWRDYGEQWQTFHDTYTELDDGHATQRYLNDLIADR